MSKECGTEVCWYWTPDGCRASKITYWICVESSKGYSISSGRKINQSEMPESRKCIG
jgi:hypothetical protein